MSTANRVIKNTGYLYAKMAITMFISLYATRLILNSLGASDFGIFNIVGGAIAMLGFLNNTMSAATQRFMNYSEGEGNKEKQKKIFNVGIVIHASIALFMGIVLVGMGWVFFNGVLNIPEGRKFAAEVVYGCLIVSTMLTMMNVPYEAAINAHENMLYYAVVGIIESLLKLSVAFACVYTSHDKLVVYGVLMAAIPWITLTIMKVYCHRHYEECVLAPRRYFDKSVMKEMTGFAGWNFLGATTSLLGNYGMGIIVNHFYGTVLNAAMGIATQLNGQLLVFSNNMMKALNPVIVKSEGAQQHDNMVKYAFIGCKFGFYLLAVFAIPFMIEAPYILRLWLKNVPEWTVLFVRLQIIRSLIELTFNGLSTSLNAVGDIKAINISAGILYLLPLVVSGLMFHFHFPPYWIYLNAIIFMSLSNRFVWLICCKKFCGIRMWDFVRKVVLPALICFALPYCCGYLYTTTTSESFLRLIVCCLVTTFAFITTVWFAGLDSTEKSFILSVTSKLKKKISHS